MEGLKRFAVMATGLATILVGCTFPHRGIFYGTTFFTYDLPHYVWDRKHFDYYLPLNTWVDDSVRVHTLEANIKHVKAKDSDKRSTADIAVEIYSSASAIAASCRRSPPIARSAGPAP